MPPVLAGWTDLANRPQAKPTACPQYGAHAAQPKRLGNGQGGTHEAITTHPARRSSRTSFAAPAEGSGGLPTSARETV